MIKDAGNLMEANVLYWLIIQGYNPLNVLQEAEFGKQVMSFFLPNKLFISCWSGMWE